MRILIREVGLAAAGSFFPKEKSNEKDNRIGHRSLRITNKSASPSRHGIIGIVFAVLIVVGVIVAVMVLCRKKTTTTKKKKKKESESTDDSIDPPTPVTLFLTPPQPQPPLPNEISIPENPSSLVNSTNLELQVDGSVWVGTKSRQSDGSIRVQKQILRPVTPVIGSPAAKKAWNRKAEIAPPIQNDTILKNSTYTEAFWAQGFKPTADTKVGINLIGHKQEGKDDIIILSRIKESSIFAGQGLRQGMIVKKINSTSIKTVQEASFLFRNFVGMLTIEAEEELAQAGTQVRKYFGALAHSKHHDVLIFQ